MRLRDVGDVHRNPSRLIREQLGLAAERRLGRFNQLNALSVGVMKAANTTNLLEFAACPFGARRAVLPFVGLLLRDVLWLWFSHLGRLPVTSFGSLFGCMSLRM